MEYYDLDGNNFNFKGDDVLRMVNLRFHDLGTLDGSKKYVLGLKLVSDDLAVNQEKSTMTFFLQQKQGEIDNPYTVATTSDLITLGEKLKDGKTIYAKIENDIDLQGVDWQPIETSVSKQLVLDGGGHTIRNLKVNTSSSVNQGFFGLLVGKCSNINFENAQITANQKLTGVLAGHVGNASAAGVVENVRVSGTINLTSGTGPTAWENGQAGGICGRIQGAESKIYQCSSEMSINATWSAGGICGEAKGGATITQCYFVGDIVTKSCVGGIVSRMFQGTVTHCYSSGVAKSYPNVTPPNPGAGIAGLVEPSPTALISHCYSECEIAAQNQVGGILGLANKGTGVTVTRCVAWNSSLYSNGAPKSGRVCGRFDKNEANNCYANPNMECRFSANTPAIVDEVVPNYSATVNGADRYNGLSTIPTLMAAVKALQWDESIWDLSGEKPRLVWELAQ